jgi:CheY-like chemotaxis protein
MNVVLIIDDDWAIRETLTDILRAVQPNLRVLSAANGHRGMEMALNEQPDLILLDAQMPDMNGAQLATSLRQTDTTSKIPLVAISGSDPSHPAAADLYKLCDGWLNKPFSVDCLLHLIQHLFEPPSRPAEQAPKRYHSRPYRVLAGIPPGA